VRPEVRIPVPELFPAGRDQPLQIFETVLDEGHFGDGIGLEVAAAVISAVAQLLQNHAVSVFSE